MKTLFLITLLLGIHFASGSSDHVTLYIERVHAIIKPPDKIEINFKMFADHLGLIESSGQYDIVNSIGAMGKYQFLSSTLELLGYHNITPERFKENPDIFTPGMQEQALKDLVKMNENTLKKFTHYIGKVVNGVQITKAGLLAASHLAGAGGVIKFLTHNQNATDMNGSSVQKYLKEFQNFLI